MGLMVASIVTSAIGTKRTFAFVVREAAFDPKRTCGELPKREGKGLQRVCNSPLPEHLGCLKIGGEGGIRTHGADRPHNGFRVLRFSCWHVPLSS
jgi:hypothetical protein